MTTRTLRYNGEDYRQVTSDDNIPMTDVCVVVRTECGPKMGTVIGIDRDDPDHRFRMRILGARTSVREVWTKDESIPLIGDQVKTYSGDFGVLASYNHATRDYLVSSAYGILFSGSVTRLTPTSTPEKLKLKSSKAKYTKSLRAISL